jgi:hypothetical protein
MIESSTDTTTGRYAVLVQSPDNPGLLELARVEDREFAKRLARLLVKNLGTTSIARDRESGDVFVARYNAWTSREGADVILGRKPEDRPSTRSAFGQMLFDLGAENLRTQFGGAF